MGKRLKKTTDGRTEFLGLFRELCYSRQNWQVWADLMTAFACTLANAVDRAEPHYSRREKEYARAISALGSVEIPAQLFAITVTELDRDPEQDFLGALYMELNLGSHWAGQFFTPYCVCKAMAEMTVGDGLQERAKRERYISICDPACGAGATLIAAANAMRHRDVNYQQDALFIGQDVDGVVAKMCFIQLSLLGCAGYICVGDSLANPVNGPHVLFPEEREGQEIWYMPMFATPIWAGRRLATQIDALLRSVPEAPGQQEPEYTFFFDFKEDGYERNTGQGESRAG